MTKFRTIKECHQLIKTEDPNTAISEYFIRDMCQKKQVPYLKAGCKYLVNYDELIRILNIAWKEKNHGFYYRTQIKKWQILHNSS